MDARDESTPLILTKSSNRSGKSSCIAFTCAFVLAFLVILLVAALVPIGVLYGRAVKSDLCLNESCVKAAAFILNNIDTSYKPCNDFYNFSCANFARERVPTGGSASTFGDLAEKNIIALKKILDANQDDGIHAVRGLLDLYQSCLAAKANPLGPDPLLDVINKTGGWGILSGKPNSTWNFNSTDYLMDKTLGSPAFFTVDVTIDDKNSSRYILEVSQSGLTFPSDDYDEDRIQTLSAMITNMLDFINPDDNNTALYTEVANEIAHLEASLAKIFVSEVDLRNVDNTYNKMNLSNLSTLFSNFDWVTNTQKFLNILNVNITVNGNESILVRTPSYFKQLAQVLSNFSSRAQEGYAKWQLIKQFTDALPFANSQDQKSALRELKSQHLKPQEDSEDEDYQFCVNFVQNLMPIALSYSYTKYVLPPNTKEEVSVIIDTIKVAFKERLDKNDWIDDKTRQASKDKVDAITKMVAYPDQVENATYLNGLYSRYTLSPNDTYGNYIQFVEYGIIDSVSNLRQPVDKTEWQTAPTAVNAYYDPQFNQFVFLEGILRVPFFQADWPAYLKYGALGVVVGHELTHGFDDQGQRYNKDGIVTQWWTNSSIAKFKQRQECFVKQYSDYEIFGYNVNGNLTLGENIADNGGIKAAFQAYQDFVKNSGKTPQSLPALDSYTDEQMFYIAFGQLWCSLFTPEFIKTDLQTNPHSPGPFRVLGSLVNNPDFATTFNCPKDSPMNPSQKCLMW